MPRKARQMSRSGIYHVMLRGINKQDIFEEPEDYAMFLQMLSEVKTIDTEEAGSIVTHKAIAIYAYCLMTNHVHLLLRTFSHGDGVKVTAHSSINVIGNSDTVPVEKDTLGHTMKRLGRKYAMYYNRKYGRVGTLFDDRYKSEVVEDEQYLLTCFCYIHRNPLKAGIVQQVQDYPWSSWAEYTTQPNLCTTAPLLNRYTIQDLHQVISTDRDGSIMEFDERRPLSDTEAKAILHELIGAETVADVQRLTKPQQRQLARDLYDAGAMWKQISRLTGLSINTIKYACGLRFH